MPWCPRCDETFPEGPACPRCNARLIQREGDSDDPTEALRAVPATRAIRASRRHRRAMERLSGPRPQSLRLLAFSIVALVFVSGFLLGRFAGITPSEPTVRPLAAAAPLALHDIEGSTAYALWSREPLATIAVHDLYSGEVAPLARFSPPSISSSAAQTRVVSFGRSVALVIADDEHSFVAFAASGSSPYGWAPGVEAAWGSEHDLYVRQKDGRIVKWTTNADAAHSEVTGSAKRIFQTPNGAAAEANGRLSALRKGSFSLDIPQGARVVAVSPDTKRALVDSDGPALWDGAKLRHLRIDGFDVMAASFERSGERAAVTLKRGGELTLAVVDTQGNAALKPLGTSDHGCTAEATWDAGGHWLYVAPGDGLIYAVEAAGGRVERVHTRGVGCGVAWLAGN